jgi:hypothetical protein
MHGPSTSERLHMQLVKHLQSRAIDQTQATQVDYQLRKPTGQRGTKNWVNSRQFVARQPLVKLNYVDTSLLIMLSHRGGPS